MMSSIKFFVSFLTISASISVSIAYPYDDHKYFRYVGSYPSTCCQLEWTDINPGVNLPKDYVKAGNFLNRDWAYVGLDGGYLGAKSDQSSEEPNWLDFPDKKVNPYPILTNPNKCTVGWYTTRFSKEEVPLNPDWHFPRVWGTHNYGDFGRYQGSPSFVYHSGNVFTASSLTGATYSTPENYELLYVDCKKSILSMSSAKLFNISYDKQAFEDLKTVSNRVVYTKKIMVNNSPEKSESEIKFQIETFDNASLTLSNSHSNYFKTDEQTYRERSAEAELSFLELIGFKANGGYKDQKWINSDSGNGNSKEQEIFRATARRELFEFSQKVTIPPYSKTTLVAFSKPIKGNIPFTAIYELFPTGSKESNTASILENTLRHYGMDQKMVETIRGTLLVHYDGTMHVDAGHEVDVDIQSVKLVTAPPELFY